MSYFLNSAKPLADTGINTISMGPLSPIRFASAIQEK